MEKGGGSQLFFFLSWKWEECRERKHGEGLQGFGPGTELISGFYRALGRSPRFADLGSRVGVSGACSDDADSRLCGDSLAGPRTAGP